jgi:hypothetical protein
LVLLVDTFAPYSTVYQLFMPSDHETEWFDQLQARIEEHNKKDLQAIARAREERVKWLQAKDEDSEQPSPET